MTGCGDLLDVNNPNNLVEESVQLPAAAEGVVNGSLRAVSRAASDVWEGPAGLVPAMRGASSTKDSSVIP